MSDHQQRQLNGYGDSRRHSEPSIKRRRITKACDFCHRRGRKCKPAPAPQGGAPGGDVGVGGGLTTGSDGHASCLTCIEHGATCTWNRIAAKRGVKSKTSPSSAKQAQSGDEEADRGWTHSHTHSRTHTYDESRHGSRNLVYRLLCIFFDTVYPVFPFYDEETLFREWDGSSLSSKRAAFARLMAVCALSASHVRDGALFKADDDDDVAGAVRAELQQTYLEDARRAIPDDNRAIRGDEVFEYLQVLGTLSLAAIQTKDEILYEQYLGRYHNLVAQDKFQFESNWGVALTAEEIYVRRQFFWSMYRLEVHSALISGHVVRCPELQCGVAYPVHVRGLAGVLDPTGMLDRNRPGPGPGSGPGPGLLKPETFFPGSWLTGWNYITDLYRVLEHVVVRMRKGRVKAVHTDLANIDRLLPSIDDILVEVLERKRKLPMYASQAFPASDNREENLCGFQVANIACTYQLLRMAAFACEDQFEEACSAAIELIDEITNVPVEYLRAIGHPMLQELAGVGHLLSSFIGRQLLAHQYYKLRKVMHAMATFLQNLGPCIPNALQISVKLFQYITKIDDKIDEQMIKQSQPPPPLPLPAAALPHPAAPAMPPEALPPELHAAQVMHPMIPPNTIAQYPLQNTALFDNLPMNFMNNVFSTAFSDTAEIDWYTMENYTA
ncbi:hypothetical protein C8034_v009495 [Colletotrichum sidae]|uniref:Zn(2)-C6 fungal-type domain-containing protein n=1 Tax=Colletotrichum sidae TaxID=1347389 RepID=A0A4R8TJK4_9PEZI|nr:hypothetical protein C8034_v009495 [Colletotrichum sidae]